MKFWTQQRDDETVRHVAVALTQEEAWNSRHSPYNMLGLGDPGRSRFWLWFNHLGAALARAVADRCAVIEERRSFAVADPG